MTSLLIEDRAVVLSQEQGISYADALAWVLDHPETGMGKAKGNQGSRKIWINNDLINRRIAKEDALPKGWRYGRIKRRLAYARAA